MSRMHAVLSDQLCAKCSGTIGDWLDPHGTSKILARLGWCSWCVEYTSHQLEQSNTLRRNYYTCNTCTSRTLPCVNCPSGMACGGATWNDNLCAYCSNVTTNFDWKELKQKKDTIMRQQRTHGRVMAELNRYSEHRDQAKAQGMERPFLLLVSMSPSMRNQVACILGWTIITTDYFGDPHHEAWDIINRSRNGLQARANQSYETLNPMAHNCTWYDVLRRVNNIVFHHCSLPSASFKASLAVSQRSGSAAVQELEVEFLSNLADLSIAQDSMYHTEEECLMEDEQEKTSDKSQADSGDAKTTSTSKLSSSSASFLPVGESLESEHLIPESTEEEQKISEEVDKDWMTLFSEKDAEQHARKAAPTPSKSLLDLSDDSVREILDKIEVDEVSPGERAAAVSAMKHVQKMTKELLDRCEKIEDDLVSLSTESLPTVVASEETSKESVEVAENVVKKVENDLVQDSEEIDSVMLEGRILYIKKMMVKNTGIQRENVLEYSINVGLASAGISKLSVTIMGLKVAAYLVPTVAGVALPAAAALSLLATPMMIIGIVGLASTAVTLTFGSSEGQLFWPVVMMLNQRILLALENINIDDLF